MLKEIRSHKYQEAISYYDEDITFGEYSGEWTAPGVGNRTGKEYVLYFEELGPEDEYEFIFCKVERK